VVLLAALVVFFVLTHRLAGSVVPRSPADALIFQSTLLFVVLGSAVIEHKFTRPADSVVNALMGVISLVTVYGIAGGPLWWLVAAYCVLVLLLSLTCVVVSTGPDVAGWRRRLADWTYRPAVVLGRARLLYSVVFLYAVFSFYGLRQSQTAVLVVFWGLFMAIWPLGIPELLSSLGSSKVSAAAVGRVIRLDFPNLLRIELNPGVAWDPRSPVLYEGPDGRQSLVLPLYSQSADDRTLATGLTVPAPGAKVDQLQPGYVYPAPATGTETDGAVCERLGGNAQSKLVGFVVEDSRIPAIRFETWRPDLCREGLLVWCPVEGKRIFYQVTAGATDEESLASDRHGFQCATAAQLGLLDAEHGFSKYPWLPSINTPVFCEPDAFGENEPTVREGDFVYGTIPGTKIRIGGPFADAADSHTAILGVTGSGKTELALDLIRYALTKGMKVICIDLTARYREKLKAIPYKDLSISSELSAELGEKLFEAETGSYGAGAEKKALKGFREELRAEVTASLEGFLTATDAANQLGVISLDEISNTKATLDVTELHLTCLLHFARDHQGKCPRVLLVVEEAHTVMPESNTMGLGDYDSRGLVSKIAQIALQGRKYGVGLLVIAQRTATVTKTVLTQCNTVISLSCFDETSIGFLENVFGEAHARLVATLPRLHAVVFGKGVRSERPIVVEIPFNAAKAEP
jgi:hypothetical protein